MAVIRAMTPAALGRLSEDEGAGALSFRHLERDTNTAEDSQAIHARELPEDEQAALGMVDARASEHRSVHRSTSIGVKFVRLFTKAESNSDNVGTIYTWAVVMATEPNVSPCRAWWVALLSSGLFLLQGVVGGILVYDSFTPACASKSRLSARDQCLPGMCCSEFGYCKECEPSAKSCQFLVEIHEVWHNGSRLVLMFLLLLLSVPMLADADQSSLDGFLFLDRLRDTAMHKRPLSTRCAQALLWGNIRAKSVLMPWIIGGATCALVVTSEPTVLNLMLNSLAASFLADADDMLSALLMPVSVRSKVSKLLQTSVGNCKTNVLHNRYLVLLVIVAVWITASVTPYIPVDYILGLGRSCENTFEAMSFLFLVGGPLISIFSVCLVLGFGNLRSEGCSYLCCRLSAADFLHYMMVVFSFVGMTEVLEMALMGF